MDEIDIGEDECADESVTEILNDGWVGEGLFGVVDVECEDNRLVEVKDLECGDVGDGDCTPFSIWMAKVGTMKVKMLKLRLVTSMMRIEKMLL